MKPDLKQLLSELGIAGKHLPHLEKNWMKSVDSFPEKLPEFLRPSEYRKYFDFSGLPKDVLPVLDETAAAICQSEGMLMLAWHCYCSLYFYQDPWFGEWPDFEKQLGDKGCVFYLLIALSVMPLTLKKYYSIGIPKDYAIALCSRIKGFYVTYFTGYGKPGLNPAQLFWFRFYSDGLIFRVGRFEFMPKQFKTARLGFSVFKNKANCQIIALQTDKREYDKNGWCIKPDGGFPNAQPAFNGCDFVVSGKSVEGMYLLPEGLASGEILRLDLREWETVFSDDCIVLDMHIPEGGKMTADACRESFTEALAFFKKYFPEKDIRGFVCCSWIFYPLYEQVLPCSNLAGFMRNVYLISCYPEEIHEGFYFIFGREYEQQINYPRNNSVRNAMLDEIESGGKLRGGMMFYLAEHTEFFGQKPYREKFRYCK